MMNERIKQLLNESTSGNVDERDLSRVRTVSLDEMEKFARLIVKECAGIYDLIDNGNRHMGTDNYLEALHRSLME